MSLNKLKAIIYNLLPVLCFSISKDFRFKKICNFLGVSRLLMSHELEMSKYLRFQSFKAHLVNSTSGFVTFNTVEVWLL